MASGGSLTGNEVRGAVFAKPPLGSHGYDSHEVDEFMDKIAATLDGFGSVTADEVADRRFSLASSRWGNRGYRQDEVDAMLAVVASILRGRAAGGETPPGSATPPWSAAPPVRQEPIGGYQLRQAAFRKVSPGRGYDTSAVDEFLEQMAIALDGSGPRMTPEEVHRMTLPTATGLHRGYDELEVDALLDRIVAELRRRNSGG
ncbi:DivIVA domain-containing protein [Jatrophihabitans sp.]|uniref:DivIVA domain-containing protein n=1 Tax=Jatrophihabitans sp. TaxID=1932789 RepID=UPI002C4A05F0|nr:DivIVA domain-containing protein [Jatrophihabitans sp.]